MIKKFFLPVILLWRDRSIDVAGAEKLVISFLYIRKGRTLTIKGVDPSRRFEIHMGPRSIIRGDVRLAKKPTEMSVEDLQKFIHDNAPKDEKES